MGFKGFLSKSLDSLNKVLSKKSSRHLTQLNKSLLKQYPFGGPRSGVTAKDLPNLEKQQTEIKEKYDKKEFLLQSEQKEIWEISELITDALATSGPKNTSKDFPINWEKLKWAETPDRGEGYYYVVFRESIHDKDDYRRPTSTMILYTKSSFDDKIDKFYWAFLKGKK